MAKLFTLTVLSMLVLAEAGKKKSPADACKKNVKKLDKCLTKGYVAAIKCSKKEPTDKDISKSNQKKCTEIEELIVKLDCEQCTVKEEVKDPHRCKRTGVDYPGADISNAAAGSFEACAARCRATPGCISITYRPSDTNCWLKSRSGGAGPRPHGDVDSMNMDCSLADSKEEDPACVEQNTDYPGADIKDFVAASFSECQDFCVDYDDCFSVTFRPSDSRCWLKKTPYGGGAISRQGLLSVNVPCGFSDCRRVGVDYPGADISDTDAGSFEACAARCRATPGCLSITYRPSDTNCWLKNSKGGASPWADKHGLVSMNMECAPVPSGTCWEEGVDYPGADIKDFRASSGEQCSQLCSDAEACKAVTFRPSDNHCWLKSSPYGGEARPGEGLLSTNVPCTSDNI